MSLFKGKFRQLITELEFLTMKLLPFALIPQRVHRSHFTHVSILIKVNGIIHASQVYIYIKFESILEDQGLYLLNY